MRFGADGSKGLRLRPDATLEIVDATAADPADLVVHDAEAAGPQLAFLLSRLGNVDTGVTPIGVFRSVQTSVYDDEVRTQIDTARAASKPGTADLESLLAGPETWQVG